MGAFESSLEAAQVEASAFVRPAAEGRAPEAGFGGLLGGGDGGGAGGGGM